MGAVRPVEGTGPPPAPALRFLSFRAAPGMGLPPAAEVPLEVLKTGHRRGVYRARVEDRRVVVKLSFHPLARWKLARERRALVALRSRGVPVPRLLGEGRTTPGRWAILTEEVEGARSFGDAFRSTAGPAARRALLWEMGKRVRALHRQGVEHRDPHPANLLLGREGPVWVDATSLRPGARRPLPRRRAMRNLAAFHRALAGLPGATERDGLCALLAYLGEGGDARPEDPRPWIREVLEESRRIEARLIRRRSRRCLRSNRDFLLARGGGVLAAARREALGPDWERLLRDPDSLLQGAAVLKHGRSTLAARITWNGAPAFLKRYHRPGLLAALKRLLRGSAARRSWRAGHALELAGVPSPRPLAFLERRRGLLRSWLITEWVEGVGSERVLGKRDASAGRLAALCAGLARAVARLHALGIRHRDLKPPNVLLDAVRGEAVLLDLDGVRFPARLTARMRRKDLSRWLRDEPAGDPLRSVLEDEYRRRMAAASSSGPAEV